MASFIIKDVRLFDGEKMVSNSSVLIENGFIIQVGEDINKDEVSVICKPGHTLLPGLIDAHCHPYREEKLSEQAFRFGITTLMDLHNLHENAVQQKEWAKKRKVPPQRLLQTNTALIQFEGFSGYQERTLCSYHSWRLASLGRNEAG